MTLYFNCFETAPTKEALHTILNTAVDTDVTVLYDTNDSFVYDRNVVSDEYIVDSIIDYIEMTQNDINEGLVVTGMLDENVDEEAMIDAMYQEYLAETDGFGDREDAILHHYCA